MRARRLNLGEWSRRSEARAPSLARLGPTALAMRAGPSSRRRRNCGLRVRTLSRIDDLLSNNVDYDEFERRYYLYFLDEVPQAPAERRLDVDQNGFFSSVQVKMDWTTEAPDQIDKGYGWLTPSEYVEWLRAERESYRSRYGR